MAASNTIEFLNPEFVKDIMNTALKVVDDQKKEIAKICWENLLLFLAQHWIQIIMILFIILVISFIKALSGQWGMFGSVLYHYLHIGVLFIIGLIWGPEIYLNIFFGLINLIIYLYSFKLVGKILDKLGLRRKVRVRR